MIGVREMMLASYDWPKSVYSDGVPWKEPAELKLHQRRRAWSAANRMHNFGLLLYYGDLHSHTGGRRRIPMDVDAMAQKWKETIAGLCLAHDKDEADRFEAKVDECLTPILSAPIKQVRELAPKILALLKEDKRVPFLVWRAYEVWVDQMKDAPDDDVKELKTQLAREIVDMVEDDAKAQLPEAMVRALQWRAPSTLEKVKAVVAEEKAAGRGVKIKGRESCLFLEAGGTEEKPEVCVQI